MNLLLLSRTHRTISSLCASPSASFQAALLTLVVLSGPVLAQERARQWFSPNRSFSECFSSRSPAERIRMIQDEGRHARVKELPNGSVEVAVRSSASTEEVWTYYPDERTCVAQLPRSQAVPSRYE